MILKDAFFSWDSNDLSSYVQQVELTYEAEEQDGTAMGDDTRVQDGGLKNWTVTAELFADESAGGPNAILHPDVGTTATVVIRPVASDPIAADNPEYSGTGMLQSINPVAGTVGEQQMVSANISPAGDLNRVTS